MEKHLQELVEEVETEASLLAKRQFRSTLNQPNLLAINSKQAIGDVSQDGFYKFAVNMPRPVLDAESIQLVNANIPQCVPNIPDTACAFWYYRLSEYSGKVPNQNNLFFVRLLPSYYRKEFIDSPQLYGFNVTFGSYADVSTQLALACARDLANDNLGVQDGDEDSEVYDLHYLPSEISIAYNSGINKFQMTGTNATTSLAYIEWDTGTTYGLNQIVAYNDKAYKSLVSGNVGNNPTTSPGQWVRSYVEVVQPYNNSAPYRQGQYVSYNNVLYIAENNTIGGGTPDVDTADWSSVIPTDIFYRYLITGYDDPNVALNQGSTRQLWNQYALFEELEQVEYNGAYWVATTQNKNFVPFTINNAYTWNDVDDFNTGDFVLYQGFIYKSLVNGNINNIPNLSPADWDLMNWDNTYPYNTGDIVYYLGVQYECIVPNFNVAPNTSTQWKTLTWVGITNYSIGDIVSYNSVFYIATQNNRGQVPSTFSQYWSPNTFWAYTQQTTGTNYPKPAIVGLYDITKTFDYIDAWEYDGQQTYQYPFPVGIAAQPFNPNPKRILNTILGFTWNGVMTPSILDGVDTFEVASSTSTTTTQLFNRLRPVPKYFVKYSAGVDPVLGTSTATATQVYTAEGYCNLVYSSILSIYATIVYGSTLDTQRNTNLLAMGTMDCGNLGVSFFNPIVNNPLKVSGSDIYSIQFEMLDECGEPYFLTNNAIVSFVLKVAYKKDA